MEKITKDNFHKLDHIPTHEIVNDIKLTKDEISNLQKRLETFEPRNGGKERVDHYITEGNIAKRQTFVKELTNLLELRKNGTKD